MSDEQESDVENFVSGADCKRCGSTAHGNPNKCPVCEQEWSDAAQRLANYLKRVNEVYGE